MIRAHFRDDEEIRPNAGLAVALHLNARAREVMAYHRCRGGLRGVVDDARQAQAQEAFAFMSVEDQRLVQGGTALQLWPELRSSDSLLN